MLTNFPLLELLSQSLERDFAIFFASSLTGGVSVNATTSDLYLISHTISLTYLNLSFSLVSSY